MLGGQDTNRILGFLLGHTSDANWQKVLVVSIASLGLIVQWREVRSLNLMAMGDAAARRMGVETERTRNVILGIGTAMTAAVVGTIGIVGFIGLLGPHMARKLVGVDWRRSMPVAVLLGGVLMVISDLVAQRVLPWLTGNAGMEVNVGIVAALLGAPTLLVLLRRSE
jgi:iron complex transport system permease protein